MTALISPEVRAFNSTSYSDIAGLDSGIVRLPGESNAAFVDRLLHSASAVRDHTYQGTINEIALELGLGIRPGILVTSADLSMTISTDAAGVHIGGRILPLFTIDPDSVWNWRKLSDLVNDVNSLSGFTASLIGLDGPALQICRQSNLYTSLAEVISGSIVDLKYEGVISSTLAFNVPVPSYTLSGSRVTFSSPVPDGTQVTYQYKVWPYSLVCSDVSVIGLTEPGVSAAIVKSRVIAYQVREALQEVTQKDRSYWGR